MIAAEFLRRQELLQQTMVSPELQVGAREYYRTRPGEFLLDWGITYDPRNAGTPIPTLMPFILFPRQLELVQFLQFCRQNKVSGLVEKARDMGATWVCTGYSTALWLAPSEAASIGWGSRKEQLVDRIGDPDSIFQKVRMQLQYTPSFLLPEGFKEKIHCPYMRIINPKTGATITGESGDNIGRGGRTTLYFKDESAHYARPEMIEAALGDNTDVQIDISSVNGPGNVFARRRRNGVLWEPGIEVVPGAVYVFIMDWRHHPKKTQEWYDARRARMESEGLLHIFAQEVDRDYVAAVEGTLIKSPWVQAATDLHLKYPALMQGAGYCGLDIADEGTDKHAIAIRTGVHLGHYADWGTGDGGQATLSAIQQCRHRGVMSLNYDCIGVGATAKAETNRLQADNPGMLGALKIIPWNAGGAVLNPEQHILPGDKSSPKNKDIFKNLTAQAWWSLRQRFKKTYDFVSAGKEYPFDELISIDSKNSRYDKIVQELTQPIYRQDSSGKIVVEKTPPGAKSPNLADAVKMAYFPLVKKEVGSW